MSGSEDTNLTFSEALAALKAGRRVRREGWNGKGAFLYLVKGSTFEINRPPLTEHFPEGQQMTYHAHIDMFTAQGYCVPWLASQSDLLSEDWEILAPAKN